MLVGNFEIGDIITVVAGEELHIGMIKEIIPSDETSDNKNLYRVGLFNLPADFFSWEDIEVFCEVDSEKAYFDYHIRFSEKATREKDEINDGLRKMGLL